MRTRRPAATPTLILLEEEHAYALCTLMNLAIECVKFPILCTPTIVESNQGKWTGGCSKEYMMHGASAHGHRHMGTARQVNVGWASYLRGCV